MLDRLPPGVEKSAFSKPYAKSVIGKIRLCSASESTSKFGTDLAGTGAGCAPTLDPEADAFWQL